MTITIETIIDELKEKKPNTDVGLIRRAFEFAERAHRGHKRESGEPYIVHPLSAAYTLSKMNLDDATLAACLLHDVVDDTPITTEEIEREFGKEIAFLVSGVTKLGKIKYRGVERHVENLRKMFLAMAEDIRVVLIKLVDRLHNMQTLEHLPERKRVRIAQETLEIYAPLASRLGIGRLAGQLQDLAFPYMYPEEYKWVAENTKEKLQEREHYLRTLEPIIREELQKEGIIPITIDYRAKRYWSLWRKLLRRNMNFDEIYDLIAMRIIVSDETECYGVLGVIHKNWKPLPGLIKDYIALPKPSGYQSLHTTVLCVNGRITEFQIRTLKMHQEAEFGIAAHWAYEEAGKPKTGTKTDHRRFAWVKQLQQWQKERGGNEEEFLESLKIDFLRDRIFVLTPKGDVIDLPEEATPIDFAYYIHSDLGNQCSGARVNGRMVSLDAPLQSGDVVEVITQKNKKPSEKWLEFVKTNNARSKIRSSFKKRKVIGLFATRPARINEAQLTLMVKDRVGLLSDLTRTISDTGCNILNVSSDAKGKDFPTIDISIDVKDRSRLTKLVTRLKTVEGVEAIESRFGK